MPYFIYKMTSQEGMSLVKNLELIDELVTHVVDNGISVEKIILGGFSQGACLASEYVARNPRRYGGLLVFSGGLIGPPDNPFNYSGVLDGTPVFLGCSERDLHIPLERVQETDKILRELGAQVETKIYPGNAHTINDDEITRARRIVENLEMVGIDR